LNFLVYRVINNNIIQSILLFVNRNRDFQQRVKIKTEAQLAFPCGEWGLHGVLK